MEPSSLFPKAPGCGIVAGRPFFFVRSSTGEMIGVWIKRLSLFDYPLSDDDFTLLECYGDPVCN